MSQIWVIHSSDRNYISHVLERGDARERVIGDILGGHVDGNIDRIDCYDVDEHTADDVSEDIALELARRVVALGDPPDEQVRDFIEDQCGVGTAIPAQG